MQQKADETTEIELSQEGLNLEQSTQSVVLGSKGLAKDVAEVRESLLRIVINAARF